MNPISPKNLLIEEYTKKSRFSIFVIAFLLDLPVSLALAIIGATTVLAFAPFNLAFLAIICLSIFLFYCYRSTHLLQAFLRGLFFGFGFYGMGIYWVYISLHHFGGASIPLAVFLSSLLIVFLSLFTATMATALRYLFLHRAITVVALAAFPALWVIWEWLRELPCNGFPWLFIGYSQVGTPLQGYAPLFGVYGVSLVVCILSGALFLIFIHPKKKIKVFNLLLIAALLLGGGLLNLTNWTKPMSSPIKISLVQGNIEQSLKWQPEQLFHTVQKYWQLTENLSGSQLIIWPEAAVPILPQQIGEYMQNFTQFTQKNYNHLIFGTLLTNEKHQYFNSLMLIGNTTGQYKKRHLVPFGEYTPLAFIFNPIMEKLNIPMSSFTAGPKNQPLLKIDNFLISPFICYEIAFPQQVLSASKKSNFLIVLSDDSWFGKSIALPQQLQISEMRAAETGRYLMTVTNTGITAFITPQGKILSKAPLNKTFILTQSISPMQGLTPLMFWNYYPVIILIALLLWVVWRSKPKPISA